MPYALQHYNHSRACCFAGPQGASKNDADKEAAASRAIAAARSCSLRPQAFQKPRPRRLTPGGHFCAAEKLITEHRKLQARPSCNLLCSDALWSGVPCQKPRKRASTCARFGHQREYQGRDETEVTKGLFFLTTTITNRTWRNRDVLPEQELRLGLEADGGMNTASERCSSCLESAQHTGTL